LGFDPVPSNLIKEGGGIHAKASAWKRLHRFGAVIFTPTLLQFQCIRINRIASSQKKVIEGTLPSLKVIKQSGKKSQFAGGAQQRYRSTVAYSSIGWTLDMPIPTQCALFFGGSHTIWRYPP